MPERKRWRDIILWVFVITLNFGYFVFYCVKFQSRQMPDYSLDYKAERNITSTKSFLSDIVLEETSDGNSKAKDEIKTDWTLLLSQYPLKNRSPFLQWSDRICKGLNGLALIILIHSAPTHFVHRLFIRETWGNYTIINDVNFRRVFLFGRVSSQQLQKKLEHEQMLYGDILQSDFVDCYRNLSLNSLYGLRWVNENCPNAKVVMKADDDVVVDIDAVVSRVVSKYIVSSHRVYCNLLEDSPIFRNNDSKYFVDPNEFKEQTIFPPYCEGKTVIFTSDLVKPVLRKSYFTPFFWLEDVYMYGLLLNNISNIAMDRYYTNKELVCGVKNLKLIMNCQAVLTEVQGTNLDHMYNVWDVYRSRNCIDNV